MIKLVFEKQAWDELNWWLHNDPKIARKILELITSISLNPFLGTGKPEPLKANYRGYWSRRITQEHRLVYKIEDDFILILSAKGHY